MCCVVPLIIHFIYRYVVYKVTRSRLSCHIGPIFAGSFRYADDVALVAVAPPLYVMDKIIKVCEIFANKIGFLFHPLKSRLLCYNVDNRDSVCDIKKYYG